MKSYKETPQEEKDFIAKNYPIHGSRYCLEHLNGNWTQRQIFKFCNINNIKLDKGYEGENFNIKDFKNPSTPEMCYYLGYCWADGFIDSRLYRLSLTIQKEDGEEVYEGIKRLGHFKFRNNKQKPGRLPTVTIDLCNGKICKYLETVDFREKSTKSPTKLLKTIPENLHRYFWLGFFDGDGCLYTKGNVMRLSFSGSYNQDWSSLIEFLEDMKCRHRLDKLKREDGSSNSTLAVLSKFDIVNLFELFYKDREITGLGLDRKRDKYLIIKNLAQTRKRPVSGYFGVSIVKGRSGDFQGYSCATYFENKNYAGGKVFKNIEDAARQKDLDSINFYGHRTFTNFPITDYIELGKSISGKYD